MSKLFSPLKIRGLTIPNRIFLSPMCQYSTPDGKAGSWHQVHLGTRAIGGCGLIMTEATAVSPEGRISPDDLGIWNDEQMTALIPVVDFIRRHGAVAGIQLAHAGRKASTDAPWRGGKPLPKAQRGWQPLAPSPLPFAPGSAQPRELSGADLDSIEEEFVCAARRALQAGFQVIELHSAHGYLLHQFLSPLSNHRTDEFGGTLQNRMRFPLRIAAAVRAELPAEVPLFVRLSASDWVTGGWDLNQSLEFCAALKQLGIDLIDCSTGGLVATAEIPTGPGFQVPFAAAIKTKAGIATGAVGLISEPAQAEQIVATAQADAVFIGRELLRNPYWPLRAARELAVDTVWPEQYLRAK